MLVGSSPVAIKKINRLHEQFLRITYNDKHSNFEELLFKNNSESKHLNNTETPAIEIYKAANDMFLEIMNDIFNLRGNTYYHLRHTSQFLIDPIHKVFNEVFLHGTQNLDTNTFRN